MDIRLFIQRVIGICLILMIICFDLLVNQYEKTDTNWKIIRVFYFDGTKMKIVCDKKQKVEYLIVEGKSNSITLRKDSKGNPIKCKIK